LNAAHSLIAYSGLARGYTYVHEAIDDKTIYAEIKGLFEEVAPLLTLPVNFNLDDYLNALLRRFSNPHVPHQLSEIALDGQQKLRERIYPSLMVDEAKKLPRKCLQTTIDYWQQYEITLGGKSQITD
jgi:fructuronate reductase